MRLHFAEYPQEPYWASHSIGEDVTGRRFTAVRLRPEEAQKILSDERLLGWWLQVLQGNSPAEKVRVEVE